MMMTSLCKQSLFLDEVKYFAEKTYFLFVINTSSLSEWVFEQLIQLFIDYRFLMKFI
jgi:hypothetical protein